MTDESSNDDAAKPRSARPPQVPDVGKVLTRVGLVFGAILLLIGAGFALLWKFGGPVESASCRTKTGSYSHCDLVRKAGGGYYQLPFYLDPKKSWPDTPDRLLVTNINNGEARFVTIGGTVTCRAGQTVSVGVGFFECQQIEDDVVHFKVYKNKPYTG